MTNTYTVAGMTCGHCVQAVTSQVSALPGVTAVAIDLPTGSLTLTSDTHVDIEALRTAVDEAGYALAG